MSSPTPKLKFDQIRQRWIEAALKNRPDGSSVLDVGAGECANRVHARHLDYTSQDIAQYDGAGDGAGLQTGQFDFSQIDIVCDLLDIPEDRKFDTILFIEVLEHVPDPAAALSKLGRLLNEGGELILTAPFCSLTHFSPHFYCTGFSRYFYETHLEKAGLEIVEMTANGNYFDWLSHETGRVPRLHKRYTNRRIGLLGRGLLWLTRAYLRHISGLENASAAESSSELLTNGYLVRATRT
jgi:SAM-dependent methyltransferase